MAVFNALNSPNPRGYTYSVGGYPLRVMRDDNRQVPRLPTAGITVEW